MIPTIYDLPSVHDFPNLRKLMEEMAFDQGTPKSFYYRSFQYALSGWGDTKTVYDADRLEALARIAVQGKLIDTGVKLEDIQKAQPNGWNEEDMQKPFYDQLAAGAGEVNDVIIKAQGDWAYLLDFLDDVFNTYVPDEEKPKQIRLTAVREEVTKVPQVMGFFDTLEQAAAWIDKIDRCEGEVEWPEGFDAIAEMPDGSKYVYIDEWQIF